jgi:hypothetical protein
MTDWHGEAPAMTDDALIVYLLRHYRGSKEAYLDHRAECPEDRYDWTDRLDLEVRLELAQINALIARHLPVQMSRR